jgi:hypothetical protein
MRLLNTTTYVLSYFQSHIPAYAILSHVWEDEEVTFKDIADLNKAAKMKGFAKIVGACTIALKEGLKYIWVDTCCIDKESSAELSEAINSMFTWYKNAQICYAYLSDVLSDEDTSELYSSFAMSKWFTRGWTLQELLAPSTVVFYGADWVDIGTKATLYKTISTVTGISEDHVIGIKYDGTNVDLEDVSAAVKMSWAAYRSTSREEDMAYSLMGLFGVNMPLLYGEGEKAFVRLQHEIIRTSDDHSIFAFVGKTMLARSPSEFRQSSGVKFLRARSWDSDEVRKQAAYSITNKGLHIQLPLCRIFDERYGAAREGTHTIAFLNCYLDDESKRLAITLDNSSYGALVEGWYWRSPNPNSFPATELQFGIPSGWAAESPPQLYSIYIVDSDPSRSSPASKASRRDPEAGALTVLVTATVPAEYGQLTVTSAQRGVGEDVKMEELDEPNKWKIVCVPTMANPRPDKNKPEWELTIEFGNGALKHVFNVVAIAAYNQKTRTFWSHLRSSYIATEGFQFRPSDRSSLTISAAGGWTIDATCKALSQNSAEICIGIKRPQILRHGTIVPMPKPPTRNCVVLFVTPPAPHHGYTLAENNFTPYKRWGTPLKCAPFHGSFLVFVNGDLNGSRVAVGPFKSSLGKPFFLFLLASSNRDLVWDPMTTVSQAGWDGEDGHPLGDSYSVALDGGKKVYVSTWKGRDTSLANYVIKLSM